MTQRLLCNGLYDQGKSVLVCRTGCGSDRRTPTPAPSLLLSERVPTLSFLYKISSSFPFVVVCRLYNNTTNRRIFTLAPKTHTNWPLSRVKGGFPREPLSDLHAPRWIAAFFPISQKPNNELLKKLYRTRQLLFLVSSLPRSKWKGCGGSVVRSGQVSMRAPWRSLGAVSASFSRGRRIHVHRMPGASHVTPLQPHASISSGRAGKGLQCFRLLRNAEIKGLGVSILQRRDFLKLKNG